MLKKYSVLFLFTLAFASQSFSQEPTYDQLIKFTDNCIEIIHRGNFNEAVELFHYPPNFSPKELSQDKKEVKLLLIEMTKLFGAFEKWEVAQGFFISYQFDIGGGDIPYWSKNPQFIEVRYRTRFSNEGEGFVTFKAVQISKKLELRSVAFGIPATSPNAEERFKKIVGYMMDVMKSLADKSVKKGAKKGDVGSKTT
jgi:hypothetical protein